MKKLTAVIICILIPALLLCGCSFLFTRKVPDHISPPTQATVAPATQATEAPTEATQPPTETPTQAPTEATQPPTEAPTEATQPPAVGFTTRLPYELPIYEAAGPECDFVRSVGDDGIYTIVEEQQIENIRWGKLKSGLGWVDLTQAAKEQPMQAAIADELILDKAAAVITLDDTDAAHPLLLRPYENLTDVRITILEYDKGNYTVEQTLYIQPKMSKDQSLVVEVAFYGDMTTFGVSFLDESGNTRNYYAMLSGRNGRLIFEEYANAG